VAPVKTSLLIWDLAVAVLSPFVALWLRNRAMAPAEEAQICHTPATPLVKLGCPATRASTPHLIHPIGSMGAESLRFQKHHVRPDLPEMVQIN
jgi:hypothetical protein